MTTLTRRGRKRLLSGERLTTHLNLKLTASEYDALYTAATRRGMTLTSYAVAAIKAKLLADETYFYLRLSDGTFYPPLTEPGFEDVNNAKRSAAKREAEVVQHMMEIVP